MAGGHGPATLYEDPALVKYNRRFSLLALELRPKHGHDHESAIIVLGLLAPTRNMEEARSGPIDVAL